MAHGVWNAGFSRHGAPRAGGGANLITRDGAHSRTSTLISPGWRAARVGLILFLTISGGSWGLTRWLSADIQSRIETRARLDVQIEDARETLGEIEKTMWGGGRCWRSTGSASWCCRTGRRSIRPGPWTGGLH